jgi:signal transduction histidine kinase
MLIAERLSLTGKLARTVAHEVRNPLTSLSLALEQLKDEMPAHDESMTLYTDVMARNITRIEQLIGELLNSSKPKELNVELTDVLEVLEETISLTIDRVNLNQMKLERKFCDLPRILLDREKMKIAFINIIVNAIEAMRAGEGILQIETRHANGFVTIVFADNGKGIAKQDLDKLFDPFFTDKVGGMGLGLTSTKNILTSHNASLDVQSTLAVGTSFIIGFKLPDS